MRIDLAYYVGRDGTAQEPGDYTIFVSPSAPVWKDDIPMWDFASHADANAGGCWPLTTDQYESFFTETHWLAPGQMFRFIPRVKERLSHGANPIAHCSGS